MCAFIYEMRTRRAWARMAGGADPMTRDHARAPRLGLLVDLFEYTYQSTSGSGGDGHGTAPAHERAHPPARRRHTAGSPEPFGAERSFLYDLEFHDASVDGLIAPVEPRSPTTPTTRRSVDFAGARFRPLPMASIGMLLRGIPSVAVDSARTRCARASATSCACTGTGASPSCAARPATRTPRSYTASTARCSPSTRDRARRRAHRAGRLPRWPRARRPMRALIDERRASFQALVAANDYMALGAIEALRARGVRNAEAGRRRHRSFDDLDEAR